MQNAIAQCHEQLQDWHTALFQQLSREPIVPWSPIVGEPPEPLLDFPFRKVGLFF
jgi:hypothetical protein